MSSLGQLVVSLAANTAQFQADLGKAAHEAAKSAEKMAKGFAVVGLAITGVQQSARLLYRVLGGELVRESIRTADAMYKLGQSTGLGVTALSELSYVAKLAGVESQQMALAVQRLSRNMVDAAGGATEANRGFAALGINLKNNDNTLKTSDQVMEAIADRFVNMQDGANKTALAMLIFGKAGAALIPMLNQGSASIREMREEARALGLSMDTETAMAAERFNDNLERLTLVQRGLGNSIARDVLPPLNALTDTMVELAKQGHIFSAVGNTLQNVLQAMAVVGANVAFVFKMVGGELGVWAAQLAALARGDFKGFRLIGDEWTKDAAQARKDLDEFEKRIMGVYEVAAGGAMDMGDGLKNLFKKLDAGPAVESTEATAKAQRDAALYARQWTEAEEEWVKVMAEAADITDKFMQKQRALQQAGFDSEVEKTAYDERNKALIEFYDQQQAIAIERGAELMATDPESYASKLERLKEFLGIKEEEERASFERNKEFVQSFSDEELESMGGRHAIIEGMEQQHQGRLLEIARNKNQAVRSMEMETMHLGVELLQQFAGKSKAAAIAAIALHKGLAIAQTIASTAAASMRAMMELGPILGPKAVAWIQKMGAIQVGIIAATGLAQAANVGGGGAALGTPSNPIATSQQDSSPVPVTQRVYETRVIVMTSNPMQRQVLEELADGFKELSEDGYPMPFELAEHR